MADDMNATLSKDGAMSLGNKESDGSTADMLKMTKEKGMGIVPDYLDYGKKYEAKKVMNNSGFKLREENKEIMK